MIRRSISSLRPLLNTSRILTNNNPHLPLYRLPPFKYFPTYLAFFLPKRTMAKMKAKNPNPNPRHTPKKIKSRQR